MLHTKRALLALLVFFAGCGASQVASSYVIPPARAGTSPQRWEYNCVHAETGITELANKFGAQGWEMTAAAGVGYGSGIAAEHTMVWCIKRSLP